jgi:hypothetical protein
MPTLWPPGAHARGGHDDAGLDQALGVEHVVVLFGAQVAEEGAQLGAHGRVAQPLRQRRSANGITLRTCGFRRTRLT